MYMKPIDASKNIGLQAQTLNQKLKHNAHTQEADGTQAFFSVIYDNFRGNISPLILLIVGAPSPISLHAAL